MSDEETIEQIRENPYLQYFVGLHTFQTDAPFVPSPFVEVRRRMGNKVFEQFNQTIIDRLAAKTSPPKKRRNSVPLAFQTINRGQIAFGFFNIESDMLLLQQYFFFAGDFCDFVSGRAKEPKWNQNMEFEVFEIADPSDIGDLMGAINGIRYTGFIGKTYRRFPFPKNPDDFKQNPQGFETRKLFREMIDPYAAINRIPFLPLPQQEVRVGEYIFAKNQFQALLNYVERGGMPRWKNKIRPNYVRRMVSEIEQSRNPIFSGMVFSRAHK